MDIALEMFDDFGGKNKKHYEWYSNDLCRNDPNKTPICIPYVNF